MTKEIERKEEKELIIRDSAGEPVGSALEDPRPWDESERIRSLYPGQPEREDTYVDTVPSCSALSGKDVSGESFEVSGESPGEKKDAAAGNAAIGKGQPEFKVHTGLRIGAASRISTMKWG